jgi:multidrug efflux pump subunit AcrB
VGLENFYGKVLEKAIDHRWLTLFISFGVLIGSFVLAASQLSFQLFPSVAVDQYIVRVTAPSGTSLVSMRQQMRKLDSEIRDNIDAKYLDATLLETGQVAIDGGDPLTQRGSRYGQIRVIYSPAVSRPDHDAIKDMHRLEKIIPPLFPNLELSLSELKGGPPTGRALEVEISSVDNTVNERVARRLMEYLKTVDGVTAIESGLQLGDDELRVVLNRELAAYAGVSLDTAASHVRAAVGGLRVATTRRGTEEVDITIRYPEPEQKNAQVDLLMSLLIPNTKGGLVPLSKIATLQENPGFSTIRHKAGVRVISVTANVIAEKMTSLKLNRIVLANESDWLASDSGKVAIQFGGEEEKNQESFEGLKYSFGFALIGIFFILAIQFNNLTYPILVMLAIPFGAVGIIISFYLHGIFWKPMPLSFFSTMGMVALTGVVVNSSLVLLVFIQRALKDGMATRDAIILAGRRRLRAVILTATTTVVGLLPTAYGWGGMDPFVSPMALALSWGLMFATLVTLITIPAAFSVTIDIQNRIKKAVWGKTKTPA